MKKRLLAILLIVSLSMTMTILPTVPAMAAVPTVTSLSPNTGSPGQTLTGVVVAGANFTGATALNFSGVGVTSGALVVISDTTITTDIVIAVNAAFGPRDVTVTTAGGISDPLNAGFTVQKTGTLGSKVNSLLSLHIKLKTDYLAQPGHLPEDRIPLPGIDDPKFASLTDAGREGIFIRFDQQPTPAQLSDLNSLGVTTDPNSWVPPVGNHPTGYILADMPVNKLDILAAKDYVAGLDTSEVMAYPENDLARAAMGVQPVWDGGDTGAGVRIAVLDSGLDIQNANGTPNNNPDFPTNFAAADYSNSTANTPVTDPNVANTISGHGTHVTGSVLGRGVNSNGKYKGVAPGADLVFLKIGSDATSSASYPAMQYAIDAAVHNYQAQIITMSYGGFSVYHDGSDEICQAVDAAVDDGTTVFVSAGNSAANKWHYSGTLAAGATSGDIPITVASNNSSYLQMGLVWFDGPDHNTLSLQYYSGNTLLTSINGGQSDSDRGTESRQYYLNNLVGAGTYKLRVTNNSSHSQFFHIYYNGGSTAVTFSGTGANLSPDPNYTICSPAEADSAIAVGAYVTRKSWQDYLGNGWTYTNATLNSIATFSSLGPRVDIGAPGKPDIVAPGQGIISVRDKTVYPLPPPNFNAIDYPYYNSIIDNDGQSLNGTGPADYFLMQGTSMACPLAAGVGALLLSNNPSLTPAKLRHCLEITATDMGVIGFDTTYGWGGINASSVNNNWLQIKKLPALISTDYQFGYDVSISGDTLVVGSAGTGLPNPSPGSAYVFERNNGGDSNWGLAKTLTPVDGAESSMFGVAVSISGDTVVVGSPSDNTNGLYSGSAYVFERNYPLPDSWGQVAKLYASDPTAYDSFGLSISISGDTLLVGSPWDTTSSGPGSGSAYVFQRSLVNPHDWDFVTKLTDNDGAEDDHFGAAVSISGDNIVASSYEDDIDGAWSGSACVFERDQGGLGLWGKVTKLHASDGAPFKVFGTAVSVGGDTLVVGAPTNNAQGPYTSSAYVFNRNLGGDNHWGEAKILTPAGGFGHELFGMSVSVSDGTIVVGANFGDNGGSQSSSAYVFGRNKGGADNWGQVAKLNADNGATLAQLFGMSVSISGCTLVAGAPGSAYVFHRICCQEPPLVKVTTATNVGAASFSVDHGTIDDLTAFAEGTIPTDGKPPGVNFPFGFFSIRITNLMPGQTVIVIITLPTSQPINQYWKYHNGWIQVQPPYFVYSNGVITLTLKDGGLYDADGEENGTIVDPGAPTVLSLPDLVVSAASAVQVSSNPSQYNVVYTITNIGEAAAGPSTTSIVIDGGTPITLACPSVNAGDSDTQSTSIQTISGASDSIVITADSADAVTEGNEDNNSTNLIYSFRQYHLVTGWNTFSTPISLASGNNTLAAVLTGASYDIAYGFNALTQSWISLTGTSQIQPCDAIYIHMLADYTATLVVNTALTSPPSRSLTAGWNLIGLANLQAMKANEALLSINVVTGGSPGYSQVLSQAVNNQTGWTYIKGQPVSATGPIAWLQPGKGYWVFMISSGTLAGFTTTPLP